MAFYSEAQVSVALSAFALGRLGLLRSDNVTNCVRTTDTVHDDVIVCESLTLFATYAHMAESIRCTSSATGAISKSPASSVVEIAIIVRIAPEGFEAGIAAP